MKLWSTERSCYNEAVSLCSSMHGSILHICTLLHGCHKPNGLYRSTILKVLSHWRENGCMSEEGKISNHFSSNLFIDTTWLKVRSHWGTLFALAKDLSVVISYYNVDIFHIVFHRCVKCTLTYMQQRYKALPSPTSVLGTTTVRGTQSRLGLPSCFTQLRFLHDKCFFESEIEIAGEWVKLCNYKWTSSILTSGVTSMMMYGGGKVHLWLEPDVMVRCFAHLLKLLYFFFSSFGYAKSEPIWSWFVVVVGVVRVVGIRVCGQFSFSQDYLLLQQHFWS